MDKTKALVIGVVLVLVIAACAAVVIQKTEPEPKLDIQLKLGAPVFELDPSEIKEKLPASFDQRDLGIVTSVKYQNPWGTCWSFSGTSAAETAILNYLRLNGKAFDADELDLSEKHLAWFASHAITEADSQSEAGEGIHNFKEKDDINAVYGGGGNYEMFSYLYSCGIGPVYEESYPYMGKERLDDLTVFTDPAYRDAAILSLNSELPEGQTLETQWEELLKEHTPAEIYERYKSMGVPFGPSVTADNFGFSDYLDARIWEQAQIYGEHNQYSKFDDWTIPFTDSDGNSNRDLTIGWTMLEGRNLPELVHADGDSYVIDEYAMKVLKLEIYNGNGISSMYHAAREYMDSTEGSIYTYDKKDANHVIQIVGWDDNYSKNNFTTEAPGDGAWLIKNSWGSQTDGYVVNGKTYYVSSGYMEEGLATGYYWLSYYDLSLGHIESLTFTNEVSGQEGFSTYIYDHMPEFTQTYFECGKETKTANIFQAEDDEIVTAVSFKSVAIQSDVTVTLYLLNDGYANPEDGSPRELFNGTVDFGGYHTIVLDRPIVVSEGQSISIVTEEKNSHLGKHLFSANVGESKDQALAYGHDVYSVAIVNKGDSYLMHGGQWYDWSEIVPDLAEFGVFDNFSIKMFTNDVEE